MSSTPTAADNYRGHANEPDVDAEFRPYQWNAPQPQPWWKKIFRPSASTAPMQERAGAVELWYPEAKRNIAMPVRGTFADGYPIGAVIHTTEGYSKKGDENAEATMEDGKNENYCYFCLSATGRIYQPAPLNSWGSHCGYTYHPVIGRNLNRKLIGIEVCNAGLLVMKGGAWQPADFEGSHWRETYEDSELRRSEKVFNVTKAGTYHCMNAVQEVSLTKFLLWMHKNNPRVFKIDNVVGHDEVAVEDGSSTSTGRKQDPGASLSLYLPAYREMLKQTLATS